MRRLPVVLLVLVLAAAALADTGSTLGDRSGEGSTPFTGLAQAPEANLFTGALTTGVPLALPPGRGGMTPQLTLQYASSAGASAFGYGWDLPLGRIERSGTWGVPRCTGPHTDDFVLVLPTGASELVREHATSAYYRPRVEQAWVRAQRFETQNRWEVVDRSGRRYTFGDVDAARVATGSPAVFLQQQADGSCALTAQWALTHVEDPNGNTIDITWTKVFNVLYPATVRWGGNPSAGIAHLYTARFLLEWRAGSDRPISQRLGVRSRLAWRVYAIEIETDVPAPGTLVRRYALTYEDAATGPQALLAAVAVTGQPTQHFLYTPAVTGHADAVTLPMPPGAYRALRVSNASQEVSQTVLDMNGDGLLDLVRSDDPPAGSWAVWWGTVDSDGTAGFASAPVAWQAPGNWTFLRYVAQGASGCPADWSCTRTDTFDLTGDGIPDFVDANGTSAWVVYPGRGAPQWGFGPATSWPAPRRFLRRSIAGDTFQDVVDVNGDSRPDLVVSGTPGQNPPYAWTVYLNTGAGFEPVPLPYWPAPVHKISDGESTGLRQLLTDFNGDGLPDIVKSGYGGQGAAMDPRCAPSATQDTSCLEVYLNTGQGFGEAEPLLAVPPATGVQLRTGSGEVYQDLFDVNGDGLPDLVYRRFDWSLSSFDPEWRVLLNLGGAFEPLIYVPHTFVPGWTEGIPERVWSGGAGFLRHTLQGSSMVDVVDVNGDGLLDHVTAGAGTFSVRFHDAGQRPNLLAVLENGIGGTSSVVYRPSTAFDNTGGDGVPDLPFIQWVVDRVRQNDGLCTPPPGADPFVAGPAPNANPCIDAGHELVTSYQYEDGRFDAVDRVFRGFRRVVRASHQGSGAPPNLTATVFAQDPLAAGRILQVDTYAGDSTLVRSELNLWGTRDTGAGRSQIWLAENRRVLFDTAGGIPQYTATLSAAPDAYGNVTHYWTEGLFGAARVDTVTVYAQPTGGLHVYDKPAQVRVSDMNGVLAEQWFHYDGGAAGLANGQVAQGNLKRTRHRLSPTQADGPEMRIAYDAAGNPVSATDPNGRVTITTYDAWRLHPRTVRNALGHVTTMEFDYRWGLPIRQIDANGAVTEFAYDSAGRLICTARPGDSLANCSTTYTHHFASAPGALSWVEIARRQDEGRPPLWIRHYFDALGRPRYSDALRVVDGAARLVRSNHVEYDAGGRPHVLHHPYVISAGPTNGTTRTDFHLDGGPLFDPLARPHQVMNSDGTTRRTRYRGALTQSWDEENFLTESRVDPHGREIERRTFAGGGTTITVAQHYDGLGRVLEERQNGVVLRSSAYDSLGRRTIMIEANSGTWRYGYDAAGNLVWQDDPRPQSHVQMCYDALDRPVRRCALATDFQSLRSCTSACADPEQVRYTYDDPAVPYARGRLVRIEDASGTTEVMAYDARGRRLGVRKSIELDNIVGTAEFAYAYDTNDRVTAITYPDGEVVHTEYDDSGQPIALYNQSNVFFVTDAHYDLFGRLTLLQHGNGVNDTRTFAGPADRHRLRALRSGPPGGEPLLDLGYPLYSPRGLLRAVSDARDSTGPRSNAVQYSYDGLGRLIAADSVWDAADRTFSYDMMGNLRRNGDRELLYLNPARPHQATAVVVGGAQLQAIAHDANGNRTTKGGHTYGYDAFDRLARIETGDRTVRLVHDSEGHQVGRVIEGTTLLARTRFYDQLVEVNGALQTKFYFLGPLRVASVTNDSILWQVAAASGGGVFAAAASPFGPQLLVRLGPTAAMWTALLAVALGALLFHLGRPRRAVVGCRVRPGQALGAALLALVAGLPWPLHVAPAEAGGYGPAFAALRHYHVDHLGSTQVITDAAGVAVEHIRYLPYGGVRGRWSFDGSPREEPSDLVSPGFAGYSVEPVSGLSYAGARFYDTELGSFLTHDPKAQFSSPYSYGGGDPLNWSDPDGRAFLEIIGVVAIGAVLGAAVSTVIAAAQGAPLSAIGKAALGGAIAGAVGVGLGVAFAGASMAAAQAAGTLAQNITWQAIGQQLAGVAWRAAFSTTFANAAGQAAAAAGAPGELVTFASVAASYVASFAFDQLLAEHFSGPIERAVGQNGAQMCSNTSTHSDITTMAALDAGFSPEQAEALRKANLFQDQDVWNNQSHFDFGAQEAERALRGEARALVQTAEFGKGYSADYLDAIGAASHHVQDQYALGHILPGTSALKGPVAGPLRFLIHNTIGGEITFRQSSYDATLKLFQEARSNILGVI